MTNTNVVNTVIESRCSYVDQLVARGEQPDRRIHSAAGALRGDLLLSKKEKE